ncbi:MAG: M10 family metallopeptidase C-terminal domain-containing protein [Terricaulis sp.]
MRVTDFGDFQQRAPADDNETGLRAREGAGGLLRSDASALGTNQLPQHAPVVDLTPLAAGDDIADNTSTTTSISVGGTLNSSIQTSGDLDYISISLVAGHAYTFSLDFASAFADGYVELRDSTGALVAENDDGGIDLDSFLMYRATQTGTFYIVARGFDGGTTGSYALTTDEIVTGQTSPTTFTSNGLPYFSWEEAAIQITRTGESWATAFSTPTVVTYAYRASAPAMMPDDTAGFSTFSNAQIAATEAALAAWASIANITFVRVNDGGGYSNNATILFGNYSSGAAGAAAFAYLPTSNPVGGDVWVNISLSDNSNITPGGYGNQVLLHEIGHALGLSHPGEYDAGQGNPTYPGSSVFYGDTRMFTIMSYFASSSTGGLYSNYASLPQMFDIAAIQRLYGANTSTRSGDTVYGFNSNTGIAEYSLSGATSQAVFTIWDGGGNDTLDLSKYTTDSLIDLRPEAFSNAGPRTGGTQLAAFNISIAHGATIENAIGGSGNDMIYGNDANNVLSGGFGFDSLFGNEGNDTLNGGSGSDQMSGGAGDDTYFADASDTITEDTGNGTDTVISSDTFTLGTNIENLTLAGSGGTINGTGNELNNVIAGDGTANTLSGLSGNDTLNGAGANDVLNGGADSDFLDGGAGADQLLGGDGDDFLYADVSDTLISGGNGTDWVYFIGAGNFTLDAGANGIEVVLAGAGNDTINAATQTAAFYTYAGGGADTVTGGSNNDNIYGQDGNDILSGGDGADLMMGESGADQLSGAGGDDTLWVDSQDTLISGGAGYDFVYFVGTGGLNLDAGASGLEWFFLGGDVDIINAATQTVGIVVYAGGGADTITGGAGTDVIFGQDGNDVLFGGALNDTLWGEAGADQITGGDGDDTLIIDVQDTLIIGGNGYDFVYFTGAGNFVIDAGAAGLEWLFSSGGNDTINAATQTTGIVVYAAGGGDTVTGGAGADVIFGQDGNDILVGGGQNDTLWGEAGADQLSGGDGDDTLIADIADTLVSGGNGYDFVYVTGAGNFSINAGASGVEWIRGLDGNDTLNGASHVTAFTAYGGNGADTITGGSAGDVLFGEGGDDFIIGGAGGDVLIGGGGSDDFVFASGWGSDLVTDFQNGLDQFDMTALAGSGVTSIANLTITTQGADALISWNGNSILVQNAAGQIDASDFIFGP